jgi:hypothetical protein
MKRKWYVVNPIVAANVVFWTVLVVYAIGMAVEFVMQLCGWSVGK